jgi:hypothetical protein
VGVGIGVDIGKLNDMSESSVIADGGGGIGMFPYDGAEMGGNCDEDDDDDDEEVGSVRPVIGSLNSTSSNIASLSTTSIYYYYYHYYYPAL